MGFADGNNSARHVGARIDTNTGLTGNSDDRLATQKAIKAYVDSKDHDASDEALGGVLGGTVGNASIDDAAITLAKMADLATARIIGRTTGSTGVPEAMTAANVLTMISVASGADVTGSNAPQTHAMSTHTDEGALATLDTVAAAQITHNSVGAAELNVSGNGTSGYALTSDGDGTFSWSINDNVTNANLLTGLAALESSGGAGNEDIVIGTDAGDTIVITGNLQVDGTTTTVNSATVQIDDLNLQLADGAAAVAAVNGGGITLSHTGTDHTFQYNHASTAWKSNIDMDIATGKTYKINGTSLAKGDVGLGNVDNTADASQVAVGALAGGSIANGFTTISASYGGTGLTSVSTLLNSNTTKADVGLSNVENTAISTFAGSGYISSLGTITSGGWAGTLISAAKGGTGVANSSTITLAGNLVTVGAYATTFTTTGTTGVTLPTSGVLLSDGSEISGGTYSTGGG